MPDCSSNGLVHSLHANILHVFPVVRRVIADRSRSRAITAMGFVVCRSIRNAVEVFESFIQLLVLKIGIRKTSEDDQSA